MLMSIEVGERWRREEGSRGSFAPMIDARRSGSLRQDMHAMLSFELPRALLVRFAWFTTPIQLTSDVKASHTAV